MTTASPLPPPKRGKRTLDEAEDMDQTSKRNRFVPPSKGQPVPGVAGVSKLVSSDKADVARRTTPPRLSKKSSVQTSNREPSQMDEGSAESNSTEDWASITSADEVNE